MKFKLQDLPVLDSIEKIFFVGIKGVGVAPLAIIAKEAGFKISGSDLAEEFITDKFLYKNNIRICEGFDEIEIEDFFKNSRREKCLVITTGAHKGYDNPQVKWAKENNIVVLTQGQALALFMDGEILGRDDIKGIAVAGSHGKTTISSLLATALKATGLDPSYSVGTGEVFPTGAPGHFGAGNLFVAEADEYSSEPVYDKIPKFLYQKPSFAIFNNIDFDHPDLFEDIGAVVDAFLELAGNIKSGGKLFVNGDDKYLSGFKDRIEKDIKIITYGSGPDNDYVISKIVSHAFSSRFTVFHAKSELGFFEINIPGIHNAKNSLAVIAFLSEIGFTQKEIKVVLSVFTGTKRRCEIVGKTNGGAVIIDDYGHHPLEISTTISTIREAYPGKKLICIFQPHTYSRTKSLLQEFGKSFKNADKLLLLPIFKSQRDTEKDTLLLDEYINAHKKNVDTEFFENFDSVVEYVNLNYNASGFVILTIGAGDVYKIAYQLSV